MPTLADIARHLSIPAPPGAQEMLITGLANLDQAKPGELSFLGTERYRHQFAKTAASAVIVKRKIALPSDGARPAVLLVDDADLAMAKVLELFAPPVPRPLPGVHPAATVSTTATLGTDVRIAPSAFVGDHVRIGRNTVLHPGVYVGDHVAIGDDCELFPNVVIRERCSIGNRVVIHAGAVVGSDGFGYRWNGTQHAKVPQIGTVIIEDDVEIGSCTCIDRAKFSATVIGRGTKIDNLVQVGHNVRVGMHCVIAGQSGLAGSAQLGNGVVLGGQAALRDHIKIADLAQVAATAGVAEDVDQGEAVYGNPALPKRQWLREQGSLRRLPELVVQIRKLQEQVDELRRSAGKDVNNR